MDWQVCCVEQVHGHGASVEQMASAAHSVNRVGTVNPSRCPLTRSPGPGGGPSRRAAASRGAAPPSGTGCLVLRLSVELGRRIRPGPSLSRLLELDLWLPRSDSEVMASRASGPDASLSRRAAGEARGKPGSAAHWQLAAVGVGPAGRVPQWAPGPSTLPLPVAVRPGRWQGTFGPVWRGHGPTFKFPLHGPGALRLATPAVPVPVAI
jgi:hypothetical protein